MTILNCDYGNVKVEFLAELRQKLESIQRELTDDFDELPNDDPECETFDECMDMQLCRFFDPFTAFLDDCQTSNFFQEDLIGPINFDQMRKRFVDLAKFLIAVFEPTAKIVDECVKSQDYSNMVIKFNQEVVKNFLPVNPEAKP